MHTPGEHSLSPLLGNNSSLPDLFTKLQKNKLKNTKVLLELVTSKTNAVKSVQQAKTERISRCIYIEQSLTLSTSILKATSSHRSLDRFFTRELMQKCQVVGYFDYKINPAFS